MPPDVLAYAYFNRVETERLELERMGIYMNYVEPVRTEAGKFWVLGTRLVSTPNLNATFHEFILENLSTALGSDWCAEQTAMPPPDRHFIARCYQAIEDWRTDKVAQAQEVRPGVWAIDPDGLGQYLLSLAFDVASLTNVLSLPNELLQRLRNRDQFQGARYETAIAAIFARIDCEITFFGREAVATKHPEFTARFRPTGASLSVEAKSRHRPGVLHQPGILDPQTALRGDIGRLLREALQQDPGDQPFLVFIDLNAPPTPGVQIGDKSWFGDIKEVIRGYGSPTSDDPSPLTLVCVTNFGNHYRPGNLPSPPEFLLIQPPVSRHEADQEVITRLGQAMNHYGLVPNLDDSRFGA